MTAEKAEALERSGLWRCTAHCWLDVMDSNTGMQNESVSASIGNGAGRWQ